MFNANLKKARKEKELTLVQLSEISGVSVGYLCHLEKGTRKNPSIEIMEKIAKALQTDITQLFFSK